MLEGRGGPTRTAVLLRLHRAPLVPKGPPRSAVGGTPGWNHAEPFIQRTLVRLASSRSYLSVRRDFRPVLSSASRGSGVTKLHGACKVVRACSQHFETRRSGVGECAQPHLRLLFRAISLNRA
jgi:hypothetical protein